MKYIFIFHIILQHCILYVVVILLQGWQEFLHNTLNIMAAYDLVIQCISHVIDLLCPEYTQPQYQGG